MWIIAAAAAGLVGTVLALILGQYRPEFRMLVTAAVTLLLMAMVLEQLSPVLEQLRSTMELTGLTGDYAAILFKAVGSWQEMSAGTPGRVPSPPKSSWQAVPPSF